MTQRHWIVAGAVFALCTGILVLFTDIEVSVVRWVSCGPFATPAERNDRDLCR
jgi:hypothetical protein